MNSKELDHKKNEISNLVSDTIDKAKKKGIDQVEIFCSYSGTSEITLEKNDINTSTYAEETMYGIRVIAKQCQGFVATNDPNTLFESIIEAEKIALSQGTPDAAMELPEALSITPVQGLYKESIDNVTPEKLLHLVKETIELKNSKFPKVNIDSGEFALSRGLKLIASSKGIHAWEKEAAVYASFMGMAVDGDNVGSFDYDSAYGRDLEDLKNNLTPVFLEFMENCMMSLQARQIEGFKGQIVIPPRIVGSFLLGDFISSITASMVRKGKSKFGDKKGQLIASPLLNVTDNPRINDYMSSTSFDREGQPTENKSILDQGILNNFFYNHFEAKKAGIQNSGGSALGGASSTPGCGPRQIQVAEGKTPLSSIMNADKAILMSRFSGSTDSASGDFSGVIKGGFLLNKGEKIPVKEIQITGNIYQSLQEISAVSTETKLMHSSSTKPWVVIDNIDITGV